MKVVNIGECTHDFYVEQGAETTGGTTLNFAVHCKRLGAESVSLVGCVGDDSFGERIICTLAEEGINREFVKMLPGDSTHVQILLEENGERVFRFANGYRPGVATQFVIEESTLEFCRGHDILYAALFKQLEQLFFLLIERRVASVQVGNLLGIAEYEDPKKILEQAAENLDIIFLNGFSLFHVAFDISVRSRERYSYLHLGNGEVSQ